MTQVFRARPFRIAVIAVVFLPALFPSGGAEAATNETFRDEFNGVSYAGTDGTEDWSGDWAEFGDDGQSTGGLNLSPQIPTAPPLGASTSTVEVVGPYPSAWFAPPI